MRPTQRRLCLSKLPCKVPPHHSIPAALPCSYECTVCTPGASASCSVMPQCTADMDGGCHCPLAPLVPATAYNVSCVAINADGTRSAPSNTAAFTTDLAP